MARLAGRNIDDDFAEAMRTIGGRRPAEINPDCTVGGNADIVFTTENVIIEVKTLLEDPRKQNGYKKGVNTLYRKWAKQEKVPKQHGPLIKFETQNLPADCAHEFMRWTMRSVQSRTKKANRQIRDLKSSLQMPEAKGLFVLCNSGVSYFTPHMILYELHHTLNGELYREIDWLIYMTHGLPVQVPGIPEPVDIMSPPRALGRDKMPDEFYRRVSSAWFKYTKGVVYETNDHLVLFGVKHLPS